MQGGGLSDAELVDWIRLIRSENIGPRTFRQLIYRFGSASAALESLPGLIARSSAARAIRVATRDEALREIEASSATGVRFIAMSDPLYPPRLRAIDSAPPILAVRGDPALLRNSSVAVVGSRNASASGMTMTEMLARGLGRENYVVVSGLARGIDAAAHRASLETGTIAVLAGGHAKPYPSENLRLLEAIVQSGGVAVSEMPLEWEPRGRDFPRRNRIVSGLGLGVIVVEAARRSGSLITARFAMDQGREIFAVPGSPLDPRAGGTNDLLRDGATLCSEVKDVIEGLSAARSRGPTPGADLFGERAFVLESEPLFEELDLFWLRQEDIETPHPVETPDPAGAPPRETTVSPYPADDAVLRREEAGAGGEEPDARAKVLSLLSPAPIPLDELIRAAALPAREVQSVLCDLDLEGLLERHGGALVSLTTSPGLR
jgi:DNA processing protein